jgi:hypothetical protein
MLALVLLFVCVLLFAQSYHHQWLRNNLRNLLLGFGVVPGAVGIFWGVWIYVQSSELQAITGASLLLEFGANSLLSVSRK